MTRLHDIPCSMGDDAAQLFGASGVIGFPHLPVDFPAVRIANPFAAAGLFSWFHRKATGLRYVGISLGCATKLRHNLFRWAFERSNSIGVIRWLSQTSLHFWRFTAPRLSDGKRRAVATQTWPKSNAA